MYMWYFRILCIICFIWSGNITMWERGCGVPYGVGCIFWAISCTYDVGERGWCMSVCIHVMWCYSTCKQVQE